MTHQVDLFHLFHHSPWRIRNRYRCSYDRSSYLNYKCFTFVELPSAALPWFSSPLTYGFGNQYHSTHWYLLTFIISTANTSAINFNQNNATHWRIPKCGLNFPNFVVCTVKIFHSLSCLAFKCQHMQLHLSDIRSSLRMTMPIMGLIIKVPDFIASAHFLLLCHSSSL